MKLIEMTATFGNLHHATLRPGVGLTLIHAPNESGKSTWCAFLRAMLYGFPPRDRDKEGHLAEKNRYQPWSGAPMEGSLTLEWQSRRITLYRGPKGATPWGAFSAVYTATGEPVEDLTAETCGQTLTGVSREVFERTAFVGQGEITLSPSADLEKRVAALATTGEEEVSYSQVERRLLDWRNRRKVNSRVGIIPQLEGELQETQEALARQSDLLSRLQTALNEKESLEAQKADLESRLHAYEAVRSAQMLQKRSQAQADYDAALERVSDLEKKAAGLPDPDALRQAQGDLSYLNTLAANLRQADKAAPEALARARQAEEEADNDPYFPNLDPRFAAVQAQKDHDEAVRLSKKPPLLFWLLMGLCAGALMGFLLTPGFLLDWTPPFWEALNRLDPMGGGLDWNIMLLPFGLIGALIAFFVPFFRHRGRKKRCARLWEHYQAQTPEDILTRATDYAKKVETAQALRREYEAVEADRAKFLTQKDDLTARLLALVHPFAPEVTDTFGVSAAISRALQLGEAYRAAKAELSANERLLSALPTPQRPAGPVPVLATPPEGDPATLAARLAYISGELDRAAQLAARLQGELLAMGDPAQNQARLDALSEELARRQGEYDALTCALESLKNADSLLRERFSPAVNERAGQYLSALTGGKYDRASLTRQFQALAQEAGGPSPRSDLTLSGGATQQLYLAARLAMCDLALPLEDPCPILLDDVLDPFDDGRARLALQCLLDVAKTRQVLLFSCHTREKEMLKDAPVTVVTLS